jgi:hypothetical protein
VSPERLDGVLVRTSRRTVALPWPSRDALIEEIRHLDSMRPVVDAFEAVGAARPTELTPEQTGSLVSVIDFWMSQVTVDGLPAGVFELRNALIDDLYDTEQHE